MVFKNLREEIATILEHDPAARSTLEVVLCYPGFHALLFYWLAHWLWTRGWLVLARFISNVGRTLTGIEIHPGARIGRRLFIDHGMGVVIGETAEIGDDVTLYHGVTLGGTKLHRGKRHPTIEDGVIVSAGAKVLGGFTVGKGARIGPNAVVRSEVPPGARVVAPRSTMVTRDAKAGVKPEPSPQEFVPYGMPGDDIPDPVARALNGFVDEVQALRVRVAQLEAELEGGRPEPVLRTGTGPTLVRGEEE
ncbi:MAG TPA: serine O-acetyltransferase [Stellaceae bacterium]|jgi:serine O-acetyltransferase|nr:serine O-acetyltransferase [Stellaceae bacterium]